jgi:tRNA U34 5-methylaminomethyl-2-thiouridine-forming methyltransferase MnmC
LKREIKHTADGSPTLFLPEMNEHYHSVNGAITESDYVFVEKGYRFQTSKKPVIFEVGFGTGLNALLTALEADKQRRPTRYISIEKNPLEENIIQQLNYGNCISEKAKLLFDKLHNCPWGDEQPVSNYFSLLKIHTDIFDYYPEKFTFCDVIYFDAFAPDKQPEIWNKLIFDKIFSITASKGVFVTYSAKGEVRRQLNKTGFKMERLPGPPGKKEMLRGIKNH